MSGILDPPISMTWIDNKTFYDCWDLRMMKKNFIAILIYDTQWDALPNCANCLRDFLVRLKRVY